MKSSLKINYIHAVALQRSHHPNTLTFVFTQDESGLVKVVQGPWASNRPKHIWSPVPSKRHESLDKKSNKVSLLSAGNKGANRKVRVGVGVCVCMHCGKPAGVAF